MITDEIIDWVDSGAAGGLILGVPVTAEGFDDFDRLVLPELEASGRYSRIPIGHTLREHLAWVSSRAATSRHRLWRQSKPVGDITRPPDATEPRHWR